MAQCSIVIPLSRGARARVARAQGGEGAAHPEAPQLTRLLVRRGPRGAGTARVPNGSNAPLGDAVRGPASASWRRAPRPRGARAGSAGGSGEW